MNKLLLLGCFAIISMAASSENKSRDGNDSYINADSIVNKMFHDEGIRRITPKYLTNYYTTSWGSHWFTGLQGGASCFIGNPKGCGDMFDRTSFIYGAYVGKWHNPYIGNRLVYQGGKYKDMFMTSQKFNAFHMDLLYNVTNHLMTENQSLRRWDVIPYLGMGLINGPRHSHEACPCDACNSKNLGFMMSYGVQGRYRISSRAYVTAEIGGFHTFDDFDNHGSRNKFCDGMLSLSLGLSFNIGKNGWKHPVDAKPYIAQNDYLIDKCNRMDKLGMALYNQTVMDENTINRLRAALEAEGLLDKYAKLFDDKARNKRYYYKGLLSLRSRIREANMPKGSETSRVTISGNDSLLNAPVYFFFQQGKAKLTDESQLVNLDEIARIAQAHNLTLRIDGAADKGTGSEDTNKELSRKRCQYICKELRKRGVSADNMKTFWHGGVEVHSRGEEDRNSKVSIYTE